MTTSSFSAFGSVVAVALMSSALMGVRPVAAGEKGDDWLGALGSFIADGLTPARTMDDIRREEERGRAEQAAPPTAKVAAPETRVQDVPVAVRPAVEPAPVVLPSAAVLSMPATAQSAVSVQPAPPKAVPVPKAALVAVQPATARPVAIPEPRPMVTPPPILRTVEPLSPVEPSSRIAATATLEQAIKLGGPSDVYDNRTSRGPQGN